MLSCLGETMGWHYQVMRKAIKRDDGSIEYTYGVHEFYSNVDGGGRNGWTANPCEVEAEDMTQLKKDLANMLEDLEHYGVRDYDTGELLRKLNG